jgi:RNA polymerase sigma-70 factor (ECF subfamily)
MVRTAKKMTGDSEYVPDIIQEVFIQFFQKLNSGTEILHPTSWLYRVTLNKCVDHLRKQKKFRQVQEFGAKEQMSDVEKKELTEVVNRALSNLNTRERMLVALYSEGLSYKEISEASGIHFASVGKMLSRTLKKLELDLKKQQYELY